MLALIRAFPLIAVIVGSLGSTAIVGVTFAAWNRFIENPQIIAIERARMTALVEAAAANARRVEQMRQITIADRAMELAAQAQAELEAQHDADLMKLSERIKLYEAQRIGEGRACPLTGDDLRFLLND